MGKTLKRHRARQLKQQQHQSGSASCQLLRLPGMPPLSSGSSSSKFTFVVSAALQSKDWLAALQALQVMAAFGKVPKLGAIQRWVRDADTAGDDAVTARLIDAILRCTLPKDAEARSAAAAPAAKGTAAGGLAGTGTAAATTDVLRGSIKRHPPWSSPLPAAAAAADTQQHQQQQDSQQQNSQQLDSLQQQQQQQQQRPNYGELVYQVPFQPGAGGPDAIYAFPPGSVLQYDPQHPPVTSVQVPFVPGAQCLLGVLSKRECEQIIAAAEAIGYNADVDYTFGGASGGDGAAEAGVQLQQQEAEPHLEAPAAPAAAAAEKEAGSGANATAGDIAAAATNGTAAAAAAAAAAAVGAGGAKSAARGLAADLAGVSQGGPAQGCVWLADESVLAPLYERVAHLLPQQIDGGALAGINARWRLYRYTPGNVYRPHIDGAWPGSGVDSRGQYKFDAYGDRWSRLTFLVYLNDDFEGGHTTYYTASVEQEGCLDARGVVPRQGNVAVFPHGGTLGSLVHEGSAVVKGAKYVIRTDVLYMKSTGGKRQQQQQQQQQRHGPAHKKQKRR